MNNFKMKIQRFFRTFHIATLGAIACGLNVIVALLDLGYYASLGGELSQNMYNLIATIINCIFYLMLVKNFIQAKQQNRLGLVNYCLLIITIFDYIIPAIQMAFTGIVNGSFGYTLVAMLTSSSALGILYFVFLARNNRNVGKNNIKILIVLGILLFIVNGIVGGLYCANGIISLIELSSEVSIIIISISSILSGIVSLLMGALYFGFPLYLKRDIEKGF